MLKPDEVGIGVNFFDSLQLKRETLRKVLISEDFMVPRKEGEFCKVLGVCFCFFSSAAELS